MNMERRNVPPIAVDMKNPDFLMLARSFGCHAVRPESLSDMESAVANGLRADAPTLIEISECAPFLE
jgi:thiamine pyrophosphate-dependent acetolactate synthase large subunit-like protein